MRSRPGVTRGSRVARSSLVIESHSARPGNARGPGARSRRPAPSGTSTGKQRWTLLTTPKRPKTAAGGKTNKRASINAIDTPGGGETGTSSKWTALKHSGELRKNPHSTLLRH